MKYKEFAKYGLTFAAGVVAVLGVIGLNSLAQPSNPTSISTTDQEPLSEGENPSGQNQGGSDSGEVVTMISELTRGSMVTVEGTVTRVSDEDEFLISDSTGSIQVFTGNTFFAVEQGQQVTVKGFVDDGVFLEIYAEEILLPSGELVKVTRGG